MNATFKASALILAMVAASTASAALTINTQSWTADAIQTFTISGTGAAAAAGVTISAVGTTQRMADANPTDPETGETSPVPVFRFPVTKTSVKILSGGLLADPVTGDSSGSGLKFARGANDLFKTGIGNLSVDYPSSTVIGDVFLPTGTARKAVFTFTNNKDTTVKISGFKILVKGTVKDLKFTPAVAAELGGALKLSAPLQAALTAENWGSILVDVSSKSRTRTNATPITAAAFGL
jgi:hypothetical protein